MSSAQLKPSEFAYLLALLNASTLVGLEDPLLFPTKSSDRDATYSEGQKELEANGWMKPVVDYPDEYELNPILLEMVSVVANPEFVVVTSNSTGDSDLRQVLHYLADDSIVEVSASTDGTYQVGTIPDQEILLTRIAEMLELTTAHMEIKFTLDETVFEELQSLTQKGKPEKAETLLDSPDLNKKTSRSLLAALASQSNGQIVVVSSHSGQVTSGRRASVFGEGDSAWLAKRREHDSSELSIANCDSTSIGTLITEWINELTD